MIDDIPGWLRICWNKPKVTLGGGCKIAGAKPVVLRKKFVERKRRNTYRIKWPDGTVKVVDGYHEAAREMGIHHCSVTRRVNTGTPGLDGVMVELVDKPPVIRQTKFSNKSNVIYRVFFKNGETEDFAGRESAAIRLGVQNEAITKIVAGRRRTKGVLKIERVGRI